MTRRTMLTLIGAAIPAAAADSAAEARRAAEEWLGLVDTGDYRQSWMQAAGFFKKQVTQQQWQAAATKVRAPLGEVQNRSFSVAQATNSLPGAPDGEYVVIQFKTSFANKKSAVETITPMKDDDGVWRVSGYFVR